MCLVPGDRIDTPFRTPPKQVETQEVRSASLRQWVLWVFAHSVCMYACVCAALLRESRALMSDESSLELMNACVCLNKYLYFM